MQATKSTLNQRTYETLLSMLFSNELPIGSQLDERALAQQLGVSRTPLREAISQLAVEGLVEYRPYQGNFVKHWSAKEVEDLYIVRKSLEVLAIQLAIPKLSNEDIDRIRDILERTHIALEANDLASFGELDSQFHKFIIHKTGNKSLIQSLERFSLQIQMVRTMANRDPHVVERTNYERPRIVQALQDRDIERAARLMAEHIDGVRESVVKNM